MSMKNPRRLGVLTEDSTLVPSSDEGTRLDLFELPNGNVAVVGRIPVDPAEMPDDARVGEDGCLVILPRGVFVRAARDLLMGGMCPR